MESYWIAAAAAIISLATLILSGLSLRNKAGVDYVDSLEDRVTRAEEALERCRESEKYYKGVCENLERQNMNLMKMVVEFKESHED